MLATTAITTAMMAALLVVSLVFAGCSGGEQKDANQSANSSASSSSSSKSAADAKTEPWVSTKYFTVYEELPNLTPDFAHDEGVIDFLFENEIVASVELEGHRDYAEGGKARVYKMGVTDADGKEETVLLRLLYATESGEGVAWREDENAHELMIDILNSSFAPTELAEKCTVNFGGKEVPCELEFVSDDDEDSSAGSSSSSNSSSESDGLEQVTSPTEPFWGVWIGAFSSQEGADHVAGQANRAGLETYTEVSSDWENLNSKTYYVVTHGKYKSEAAARAELKKAKEYAPDAYVKYSGKHK